MKTNLVAVDNKMSAVDLSDAIDDRLNKAWGIACFAAMYKENLDGEIPDAALNYAMSAVKDFIEEARDMSEQMFELAKR